MIYFYSIKIAAEKRNNMLSYLVGMAETGDHSKPWLIAICMIVSIIVVAALFIMGNKTDDEAADREDENDGLL